MRKLVPIALAVIFLLAMLSFTVMYSVRFTEAAVVTTFGKAGEQPVTEPGLRFKLPYPIQSVTTYDTRLRLLQTRAEAQQTRDDKQIIIEAYLTWRVNDPLDFYESFSNAGNRAEDHYADAEDLLKSLLAGAMSEIGQYTLSDLFAAEGRTKLPELEQRILASLGQSDSGKAVASYGIDAVSVGIHRVRLAEETTKAVNERIAVNRERLAREIESAGEAEAEAIRAKAQQSRQRILAFADRRAKEIEAEGNIAAAKFQAEMNEYPDLAVFLKNLDLIRAAFSERTTVILSTDSPGLKLLDPQALGVLSPGEIPSSGLPESWRSVRGAGDGASGGSR